MRQSALLPLVLVGACATTRAGGDGPKAVLDAYLRRHLEAHPEQARRLGFHAGYDGNVPPLSAAAIAEEIADAKAHLAALDRLKIEGLADPLRLDLELTRLDAEQTIFGLETLGFGRKIMGYGDLFDVSGYLLREYAPLEVRIAALLTHVEAASQAVPNLLGLLDPKEPRTHLETSLEIWKGLIDYLENDLKAAAEPALAKDPALRARYEKVIPAGIAAIGQVLAFIEKALPSATDDFALGEANLVRMLEVNEGVKTTMSALSAMAQADFERNRAAFLATAQRIDPSQPPEAVLAAIAKEHIPEAALFATATKQLTDLAAFVEAKQLVTLDETAKIEVRPTPPFMRWNSAFLDAAGPYQDMSMGSFYYLTPPDPKWPKEEQEAYLPYAGDLLATSIHEVLPGHFVHSQHIHAIAAGPEELVARKVFESYAFTEGWAHYTEQLILDQGFGGGDPKLELGQLSNALLRNCRFLAAIGLHARGMTVDQATELFQKQCFIDPANSRQQAYRGTFDPGYLSYTFGKLQIIQLREAYFKKRGGHDLRAFHDWLLSFGSTPIALIERRL